MKYITLLTFGINLFVCTGIYAQASTNKAEAVPGNWTVFNRQVTYDDGVIHLNGQANYGVLWLNNSNFANGTIELDIRGQNLPNQSFVGFAFHGLNNTTFDGIYFRPFNFLNPDRNDHSLQYIALPKNDWYVLRSEFPGKYENQVNPVPDPDDWFHVRIEVAFPEVSIFVNDSEKPSLEVEELSNRREGRVGLWVGNGSQGWFRNIQILENN